MLADQLDYVIGVDPHRDAHALAIVDVRSGGIVFETGELARTAAAMRVRLSSRSGTRPDAGRSRSKARARSAPA